MSSEENSFGGGKGQLSPMGGLQGRSSGDSQLSHMPGIVREPPLFEQDYQRIHTLMQNKELTMSYFAPLEQQLSQGKRLKHALYESEQQHGFAKNVQRISGGLMKQEDFMGMLQEGQMFKDRSAASDHGEYTHRLQWYAVSKDMEANPQLYTAKSSSDLYRGLAERYARGQTAKYNWKSLFDENKPTGDYRQPETLTQDLKSNQQLPNLQGAMLHEHQKRQAMQPFGMLEGFKKGPERNEFVQIKRMLSPKPEQGSEKPDTLQGIESFVVPGDYAPKVRLQGQQPSTSWTPITPVIKGSRK